MTHLLKTDLGRLRIIAILEGISFILLIGIGMPLKYLADIHIVNQVIGMAHGILFLLFVLAVFPVQQLYKWSIITTGLVLISSLLPFGTFIADKKILQKIEA